MLCIPVLPPLIRVLALQYHDKALTGLRRGVAQQLTSRRNLNGRRTQSYHHSDEEQA